MAPADARLVAELENLLTRSLGPDSWEVYEPPSQRASPGCLVTTAGLLLLAWLYTRGYEHALGWLWILLSAAAGYVIARHEYARTSLRLDRRIISLRSGFPWSPRITEFPLDQLSEIRVLTRRRSRQSSTGYHSHRYYNFQIALATSSGRQIPLFREIRDEQLAGQAAHRLAELLSTSSPVPVVSKPPPSPYASSNRNRHCGRGGISLLPHRPRLLTVRSLYPRPPRHCSRTVRGNSNLKLSITTN